jgi:hypothetical protein
MTPPSKPEEDKPYRHRDTEKKKREAAKEPRKPGMKNGFSVLFLPSWFP